MIDDLQKASMWKRISAYLFDTILLAIVITLMMTALSAMVGYSKHSQRLDAYYEQYAKEYGIDFSISTEEYDALSDEQRQVYENALQALNKDEGAVKEYALVINLTLFVASFSILIAYLLLEFVVPLLFGNGQTLGKKIFSICVMRVDQIKVHGPLMFIRTVLGKFAIETMVPVLMIIMIVFNQIGVVAVVVLGGLLLLQLGCMIATKTNSAIHDLLAKTVVVDMPSQMIFESEEELIAYKERRHAEKAAQQPY